MWNFDPFEHFRQMNEELEHVFRQLHGQHARHAKETIDSDNSDVHETETGVIVDFHLPGVDKKDIQINITPTDVEVRVERNEEQETRGKHFLHHEARALSFYRGIALPAEVIPEKAKATLRNSILRIEAPKAKKRRIAVG